MSEKSRKPSKAQKSKTAPLPKSVPKRPVLAKRASLIFVERQPLKPGGPIVHGDPRAWAGADARLRRPETREELDALVKATRTDLEGAKAAVRRAKLELAGALHDLTIIEQRVTAYAQMDEVFEEEKL